MKYNPTIGLEIHLELKTKTKMFCDCLNETWKIGNDERELKPNTNVCPVCLGHPGTLPVINKEAVKMVLKAGLALNCQVAEKSKFDRKNYFYPDLPKGYQISQYNEPLCFNGCLTISNEIRIRRIHLEEDTGKLSHISDGTLVDFNRAGVPLMELVTEPDISSGKEAREFCQELQAIFRELKISDADMEKGQMRCEVNISLREIADECGLNADLRGNSTTHIAPSETKLPLCHSRESGNPDVNISDSKFPIKFKLGTKVEIKNLNSFRTVERAIDYEIARQTKNLEAGEKIVQETRGWSDKEQKTFSQRTKEESADYRYFPEPDLPPITLANSDKRQVTSDTIDLKQLKRELPELPAGKRQRFEEQYGFNSANAKILTTNPELADYAEQIISELKIWLLDSGQFEGTAEEIWENNKDKVVKLIAGWLINKLGGLLRARKLTYTDNTITAENFAEFITMIFACQVSVKNANVLLEKMLETGGDPSNILRDEDLKSEGREDLEKIVTEVINKNPDQVKQFKAGKTAILKFFIGQVMKDSRGKADPQEAENLILQKLS